MSCQHVPVLGQIGLFFAWAVMMYLLWSYSRTPR
jgi:hypothetical protein